jgi:hypothetical protein
MTSHSYKPKLGAAPLLRHANAGCGQARVVLQRQTNKTAPQSSSAPPTGPQFSPECNSFNRCGVIEPMVHAKQLVDAVLRELPPIAAGTVTGGRIVDLLNVHFHTAATADATAILHNFQAIRRELDAPLRFVCERGNPAECEVTSTGFVGGFTDCRSGADIHLCGLYHLSLTCAEQARVLVHEVAHHVPGICSDQAYVGDSRYSSLTAAQAMGNADSYAQFASMVFMGTPDCRDCGTEIQINHRRY